MSQPLPDGNYRFLSRLETANFDLNARTDKGYLIECDISYPAALHDAHNDLPFCPTAQEITEDMLSPYTLSFKDRPKHPGRKLIATLEDKKHYILHVNHLKECIRAGLKLGTVYKVLEFTQSRWLQSYVAYLTEKRKASTTEFDKNLQKYYVSNLLKKSIFNS